MVLNWFYHLSVDVSVHHRCWFWQEGEVEWDEDDWSRKGKPNRWRERLTAGEKVGGGERQHAQKSLIGRDWSVAVLGVPSNPLQYDSCSSAPSAPELLHDANQKRRPVWFLLTYSLHLAFGDPSSHPVVSQIIRYALRNCGLQREQRAQLLYSATHNSPRMQMKTSCWYIRARLVIRGVRVREDN